MDSKPVQTLSRWDLPQHDGKIKSHRCSRWHWAEIKFKESSLSFFWIGVQKEHLILSEKTLKIHIPFATTYSCETGFSALAAMKSKYHSRLDVTKELWGSVIRTDTAFQQAICGKKTSTSFTLKLFLLLLLWVTNNNYVL